MKYQQFRHNPTAVEALLFTGGNHKEIGEFAHLSEPREGIAGSGIVLDQRQHLNALPGEMVIRTVDGELFVMQASDFSEKYREVNSAEILPGVILEDYLANPGIIWYGPHPCETCGAEIIRAELEQGGVKLDAPHDHHYPNHCWEKHECRTQPANIAVPAAVQLEQQQIAHALDVRDGKITRVPFDAEQRQKLEAWQSCDWGHALEHCDIPMTVHEDGMHCARCNHLQPWVPTLCLQGPPPNPVEALLAQKSSHFFIFDVESIGLHGEGFAVAGGVYQRNGAALWEFEAACSPNMIEGGDPDDRQWVEDNVPLLGVTARGPKSVRAEFWAAWERAKAEGAIMAVECGWPVEAGFLAACIKDDPEARKWKGPYPLHEIASYMAAAGMDPMATYPRTNSELPAHNPLCDARLSARLLSAALDKISTPAASVLPQSA